MRNPNSPTSELEPSKNSSDENSGENEKMREKVSERREKICVSFSMKC